MTPDEMEKLAGCWVAELRDEGKSRHTVRAYAASVRLLASWQRANGRSGLGRDGVRGFAGGILDSGGSRDTARIRVKALKQFSAWLAAEGILDRDELASMKAPAPGNKIVPKLSAGELQAMITACGVTGTFTGYRDEAMIRLAADAPVRAEELLTMDFPDDLRLGERRAVLRKAKGNKERVVPFSDDTAIALAHYLSARPRADGAPVSGPLWLSAHGTRLSYAGLYAALGRRADVAGVRDFHPHRLRHTAAVRWLVAGGSEGNLLAIGGWERRELIDRYVADARAEMALSEGDRIFRSA